MTFIDFETARGNRFVDFRSAMLATTSLTKIATDGHWLLSIADAAVDSVAAAVQGALDWLRQQAGAVIAAMADGPEAAAEAISEPPDDGVSSALAQPFEQAGRKQIQEVKDNSDKRIDFSFSMRNPKVTAFLDGHAMGLIREITDEQRQTIRDIVTDGAKTGASTEKMARKIRDGLGLTASQGQIVENYRDELSNLDPAALDRQLRDARFDRTIQNAIDSGQPLSDDQVEKFTNRYSQRWRAYRAQTVARTESLRAAQYGSFASISAMIAEPSMDGYTVEKTWMATDDKKTRESHRHLNKETVVGLDTPFSNGLIIPHDSGDDVDASEVVCCRCTCTFKVVKE